MEYPHGLTHADPWYFPIKFPMEEQVCRGVCFTLHGMNHDMYNGVNTIMAQSIGHIMVNPRYTSWGLSRLITGEHSK